MGHSGYTIKKQKNISEYKKTYYTNNRDKILERTRIRRNKAKINRLCQRCCTYIARPNKINCEKCAEYSKVYGHNKRKEKRDTINSSLGGVCQCCKENRPYLLTLAHINNDGKPDREKYGGPIQFNNYLYKLILSGSSVPSNITLECFNCNCGSFRNNNICPHNKPIILSTLSWDKKLHKHALLRYGNRCTVCREDNLGFLTIEHINGGGGKEIKKKFGGSAIKFYKSLRDGPLRDDIQVLCYNCNCSKVRSHN